MALCRDVNCRLVGRMRVQRNSDQGSSRERRLGRSAVTVPAPRGPDTEHREFGKGETNFEQETLTRVVEARARATSIQVTPELANDPVALQKFQQAQGALSSALSRLLAVSENYPNLKSNQGFQDLRVELEGTENRIAIARNRYIKAVQDYNVFIRQVPQNFTAMAFGYKEKPQFTVENEQELKKPPTVDFGGTKK